MSTTREAPPWEVVRSAQDGKLYRRSVQAFIVSDQGMCLAFTPTGHPNRHLRQTIQGGIDRGETPVQALAREMQEEAGLVLGQDVHLVCEVLPLSCAFTPNDSQGGEATTTTTTATAKAEGEEADQAEQEVKNELGEVLDERREAFRYPSKSWRKQGIAGQELYPFLLTAHSSVKAKVNVIPTSPDVRREFRSVAWLPLSALVEQAAPRKAPVMERIVPAVYHYATLCAHSRTPPLLPRLKNAEQVTEKEYFQKQLAQHHLALDPGTGLLSLAPL